MKFMVIDLSILELIMNKNFFHSNIYNTNNSYSHNNPINIFEIKLSKFF